MVIKETWVLLYTDDLLSLWCIKSFNGFSLSTAVVSNLLGTREWFYGRHFFHEPGVGGYFQDESSTVHVLCTLFLLLLYQLQLISSSLTFWRLGTSGLEDTVPTSEHDLALAHPPLSPLLPWLSQLLLTEALAPCTHEPLCRISTLWLFAHLLFVHQDQIQKLSWPRLYH